MVKATARKHVSETDFQGYGATIETFKKLQVDVVKRLWEKGYLDDTQARAASEILDIMQGLETASLKMSNAVEAFASPPKRMGPPAVAGLPMHLRDKWQKRFRHWIAEEGNAFVVPGVRRLEVVVRVVRDNRPLGKVEAEYRLPRRSMRAVLEASLDRYGEIAGWIRPVRLLEDCA